MSEIFNSPNVRECTQSKAKGWNTWDTRSMLNHVYLPDGFCLSFGICLYGRMQVVKEVFPGAELTGPVQGTSFFDENNNNEKNRISTYPGLHSLDGSYTQLRLNIRGFNITIESAHIEDDLVLLITPDTAQLKPPCVFVEGKLLWNRPGILELHSDTLRYRSHNGKTITVFSTKQQTTDLNLPANYPYLSCSADSLIGFSTGSYRDIKRIQKIIQIKQQAELAKHKSYGKLSEVHKATQVTLAWNLIYEPKFNRILCPVARKWNVKRLGYALFCWDSFFTAWLLSIYDKELAYLQALETFREMVNGQFVPNVTQGSGRRSWDRSQLHNGAMAVWAIYQRWQDKWFLEESWQPLLNWNRWRDSQRKNKFGLISVGSNPFEPKIGDPAETIQPNSRIGAVLETMDNTPVYDDIPFNRDTYLMELADVGMTSFYLRDCQDLQKIAFILNKQEEASELQHRIDEYSKNLKSLWNEDAGIYLNKRTDTGDFTYRLTPMNLFPMLAGIPTLEQVETMLERYLFHSDHFGMKWGMPSCSKSDPAYQDQLYWRGRAWPPLDFLVYLGLKNYPVDSQRSIFVEKTKKLFLTEWKKNHSIWENYCPETGKGGNSPNSNPLYTWGALLGLISLMESGSD